MLGLRPGEAAGLYWSDIAKDVVNVTRAVRLTGGKATVVDDLKTTASKRTLRMSPDLVDWIARHRAVQLEERLAARSWADDRLVFASPTGNVLSPPNVRREFGEADPRKAERATALVCFAALGSWRSERRDRRSAGAYDHSHGQ